MAINLSPHMHAAVSVLILLMAIGGACVLLIIPVELARQSNTDRIERLEHQLDGHYTTRQRGLLLEREIHELRSANRNEEFFHTAGTPELAAANLLQELKRLVEARQGQITSVQPIIQAADTPLPRITIKTSLRGDIQTLQGVLFDAATMKPRLNIDNLTVQHEHSFTHDNPRAKAGFLEMRFDATAYFRQQQETEK